jgi:YggT family protein
MGAVLWLINTILQLFIYALVIQAVLSWLIAFGVINTYNRFVYTLVDTMNRITEPLLRPIRNFLPRSTVDFSPLILIVLIMFLQRLLFEYGGALL